MLVYILDDCCLALHFHLFFNTCLFQGAFRGASLQCTFQGSQPEGILCRKQKKLSLGTGDNCSANSEVEVLIESFHFCCI